MSQDLRRLPRLYLDAPLSAGREVVPNADQAHYLSSVMRLAEGDRVRLFNGRDGEWLAEVVALNRKRGQLLPVECLKPQTALPDLHYLFAPLKHARIDYMAQKATELGAGLLIPVLTDHTVARRVNVERLQANAVEAAEQCNLLAVPEVTEPVELDRLLDGWDEGRTIVFCDEQAPLANPLEALAALAPAAGEAARPLAVLVGPEGGFSKREQEMLRAHASVLPISLGPRIMRADTAAIAVLTLVQAACGDWR
jgi:16S rRNA (uracil1498-N3)-methyltransferase